MHLMAQMINMNLHILATDNTEGDAVYSVHPAITSAELYKAVAESSFW